MVCTADSLVDLRTGLGRDEQPVPPAAALAATFIDSKGTAGAGGWAFVLFPSLLGNGILWALASVLSIVRQRVRVQLTTDQWRSSVPQPKLRELFRQYDTSGDGTLDALELKVGGRSAVVQ